MGNIPENIKELRAGLGMTQKQLAQETGFSIGTIQGYEQGRYEPKLEALELLTNALRCSLEDILDMPVYGTEKDLLSWLLYDEIPTEQYEKILINFNKLNNDGREKAAEQVELLAKIPEYQKKSDAE